MFVPQLCLGNSGLTGAGPVNMLKLGSVIRQQTGQDRQRTGTFTNYVMPLRWVGGQQNITIVNLITVSA